MRAGVCSLLGAFSLLFVGLFSMTPTLASPQMIGRIGGRVMENGRPIRRMVEVRLESSVSGILDTAYTAGTEEFEFRGVPVSRADRLFFVIEEPGFETVREEIVLGRDPFGVGVITDVGLVTLYLNRLPDEPDRTRGDTVDVRQLSARIPEDARNRYREALDLLERGESGSALEALEQAVAMAPDYFEALSTLGAEYMRLSRYADAAVALNRAIEINGNDAVVLTNLGTLHFQLGQLAERSIRDDDALATVDDTYRQAAEYLRAAMRLDPTSARIAYYLGSALYKSGELAEAEDTLWLALDLDPGLHEARLTLVNVYVRQERSEAALEQIRAYLTLNPDSPERENLEQARAALERNAAR